MGGRAYDEIYTDCLASEFQIQIVGQVFTPVRPRWRVSEKDRGSTAGGPPSPPVRAGLEPHVRHEKGVGLRFAPPRQRGRFVFGR